MRLDLVEWMLEAPTSGRMWARAGLLMVAWPAVAVAVCLLAWPALAAFGRSPWR